MTFQNFYLRSIILGNPARLFIASPLILPLFFVAASVSADENPGLIRTTLMENPVELTSKSINTKVIRVTFPPAFKTPMHTHEGPGPRYVVKGKLKVTEDGKVNTYGIGEVFWETGKLMAVENVDSGTAELIIFELAPEK
ncbi:MAG: cupin domain-containing protein [Methyloglobulus sp.]